MAEATARGRLVAIDGAHGPDVFEAATVLVEALAERDLAAGISRWDASGLFADVVAAPAAERDLSPRTLLLLYAADLVFRVRWEIAPALEAGYVVIAAPYVHTAMALGTAAGLSHDWLATLFRFAPPATRTVMLKDTPRGRVWKRRPERGLGECCATLLSATPEGFARRKTRAVTVSALEAAADPYGGLFRQRDLRDVVEDVLKRPRRRAASTTRRRAR